MTRKVPKCRRCDTRQHVQQIGPKLYECGNCGGRMDDNPNEGGDYFADPSKRMRKAEEPQRDRSHLRGGVGR